MNRKEETESMVNFRVYFADGSSFDVSAPNPAIARSNAKAAHPDAIITKVKIMRGEEV